MLTRTIRTIGLDCSKNSSFSRLEIGFYCTYIDVKGPTEKNGSFVFLYVEMVVLKGSVRFIELRDSKFCR